MIPDDQQMVLDEIVSEMNAAGVYAATFFGQLAQYDQWLFDMMLLWSSTPSAIIG